MNKATKRAFTLVELIVVIAIIAILAVVVVPAVMNYVKTAEISADEQQANGIITVYRNYKTEKGLNLTDKNFPDYYEFITGEELSNFYIYVGNIGSLVLIWPIQGQNYPNNLEPSYFVFKGKHYTLIDAETGEIEQSGASQEIYSEWLN